ncbi:MAG: RagB/SusD family nutrient uptake outer membrane protein [Bacteroidota bacterium]|nr:RagB/SusD family nutrient uptake outer membrane protein [Bacteroidota bacterium]
MRYSNIFLIMLGLTLTLSACHDDLDVEYLNLPTTDKILSSPENIASIADGLFYNWFMAMNSSWSPRMAMWVMADQGTCSWANVGMFHLSSEPRIQFNNSVTYTYARINETFYQDMFATLSMSNDVISAINGGLEMPEGANETAMVKAQAFFIQGVILGYLGLTYDQSFIVTDNVSAADVELSPYPDVIEAALASLDSVNAIVDNYYFVIPEGWINRHSYTCYELVELANSFAARFLLYQARNLAENSETNWDRILDLLEDGMKKDLMVYMDNVTWQSYFRRYTVPEDWARIDCRIINLMDPGYPYRFPDDGINPPQASSPDRRLNEYFTYIGSHDMKPERGYYHYSNYDFRRYDYAVSTWTGDVMDFYVYESDLIKAEALARKGDIPAAVQILNAGPRIAVGLLPELSSDISQEEALEAIFYERDIELIQTGFGNAFFDMRRRDMLQEGTMLHFPIPGKELNVMEIPEYSFGGVTNADGINTSSGGWFPEK